MPSFKKLNYKFHGPFRILKYIGTQAYQLDLPYALKNIHDVFHVSLLEPYRTVKGRVPDPPRFTDVDGEDQAEVKEDLVAKCTIGSSCILSNGLVTR